MAAQKSSIENFGAAASPASTVSTTSMADLQFGEFAGSDISKRVASAEQMTVDASYASTVLSGAHAEHRSPACKIRF